MLTLYRALFISLVTHIVEASVSGLVELILFFSIQ